MNDNIKKVILLILDGWGYREDADYNASIACNPFNYNKLLATSPHILLDASGEHVGLPHGQMGNSEVGHTNLGAGRIVYQDLLRISRAFGAGEAISNRNFKQLLTDVKSSTGRLHLAGLLSGGGVHSHIDHIKAILSEAKAFGVPEVYIHAFMDGRDTPPTSGKGYIAELEAFMQELGLGQIADVSGRYYAMDRDNRWDRVNTAYDVLTGAAEPNQKFANAIDYIDWSYGEGVTDEFVYPLALDGVDGAIKDGDGLFFINFRADRMREIVSLFCKEAKNLLIMTEYSSDIHAPAMFEGVQLTHLLGEEVSNAGLRQLRIAETEKYAHVTYFFNGGSEALYNGEERILVDSPRDVKTYDLKPEMSLYTVIDKFEERFSKGDIDFAVVNFANPDMVGHTGVFNAAIEAGKDVDTVLERMVRIADAQGAALLVTADHGNFEQMWDYEHNQPYTAHTTNPVQLIIYNYDCKFIVDRGKLADVAPTILRIMGLPIPKEMTGAVLISADV